MKNRPHGNSSFFIHHLNTRGHAQGRSDSGQNRNQCLDNNPPNVFLVVFHSLIKFLSLSVFCQFLKRRFSQINADYFTLFCHAERSEASRNHPLGVSEILHIRSG